MFRNTLTFKFGKTIGLFYLYCIAASILTIIAEKIYHLFSHTTPSSYGLFFAVVLLLNAFVIFAANFFIAEIILFIIDCFRIKTIMQTPKIEKTKIKTIFDYFLFALSLLVPACYIIAIIPNIK